MTAVAPGPEAGRPPVADPSPSVPSVPSVLAVLAGHVIVAGLGGLGVRLAEQLQDSGVAVVGVDDRLTAAARRRLERAGVRVLLESPHVAEVLREAGIATALAVAICHDADLANLQTALIAADVAPAVRLVVSVSNAQLGDQIADALDQARVLNLAELAGPSFVEACVRSDVTHAFTMDDRADAEVFAAIEEEITGGGAFRARYGDLTPISLRRAGARDAEVCPPRDTPLRPGDRLTVLGRLAEFDERGMAVSGLHDARLFAALGDGDAQAPGAARRGRGTAARIREFTAIIRGELDRPFRLALLAVLTIMTVSTVVLSLTYADHNRAAPPGFGPLDALYLTVETMVTVGYGDFNFGAADEWLQVFGIGLMLFGALSIAVVYAFITNVIISRRLERAMGRGRAGAVRDHVILCGLGSVGVATMNGLLRAGRQVVVIERDENNRFLPVAREQGVPVILGDATVRSTLLEAGLAHATTIAALTSDGVANLETVLSAREAHGDLRAAGGSRGTRGDLRVVLRVVDVTLADEVERRFGIHTARSASALATPYFVGAALGHDVLSTFYVERTPFLVARMTVRAGGGLVGPTLWELSTGTRVLAVTGAAGEPDYRPGRHTRLDPGDELLVVGPVTGIVDMVRRNQRVAMPGQAWTSAG
ncbi:K+ transport system, NAD-binding component [Frankia canadensis]|uniref:K+ transport system, NAD-binding component n=1 Tax=Frankia canadensis TaxID=1836972 RepID=A0A2I2KJ33_9ACTN|nr:NAD-binding protein [Frankia canadensis]SNQ45664.1 K+ transport system, NAD-binding component [Frankia canadensis]SOU52954.1 K+ transport system, NAD-binding component [Frankia canadensis]